MADKSRKESEFNINLIRVENESKLKLLRDDIGRLEREKNSLRAELDKMKAFYEGKLQEKNRLLEKTSLEYSTLCETNEKTLIAYKTNSEKDMGDLLRKIENMAELNERYLELSNRYAAAERELHELRFSIRKLKGMNDAVDHLWHVKETEYQNLHDMLGDLRIS